MEKGLEIISYEEFLKKKKCQNNEYLSRRRKEFIGM